MYINIIKDCTAFVVVWTKKIILFVRLNNNTGDNQKKSKRLDELCLL